MFHVVKCALCGMNRLWAHSCHYCRLFNNLTEATQ